MNMPERTHCPTCTSKIPESICGYCFKPYTDKITLKKEDHCCIKFMCSHRVGI